MSYSAYHFSPTGRLYTAAEIAHTLNSLAKDPVAQNGGWKATERGGKVFVRGHHPHKGRELRIEVVERDGRYLFHTKSPFPYHQTICDPFAKTVPNMAHMILTNILQRLDN